MVANVRLRIVGCSGTVPGPASPASCYLVEADDADGRVWRIALDLGSGALGVLQRWCDPRDLDAVFVSHLHPDHCADLAALHVYLSYHPDGRRGRVPVYGPFGTASRLQQLRGSEEPSESLPVEALEPGEPIAVGPLTVTCEPVLHPVPAYAVRVEGPSDSGQERAVLAYSGDTDECDGLDRAADLADLLLVEATYLAADENEPGVHLTAAAAGRLALRSAAGSTLLTHVPPWVDPHDTLAEARAAARGMDVALAAPGTVVTL